MGKVWLFGNLSSFLPKKYEIWSEMGPYGSVGAHIKTGESSMAQDHLKTPPDPNMAHENPKMIQKSWLGSRWDYFLGGPMGPIQPVWALAAVHPRWGNRYI